jgi:hypothetical protein
MGELKKPVEALYGERLRMAGQEHLQATRLSIEECLFDGHAQSAIE